MPMSRSPLKFLRTGNVKRRDQVQSLPAVLLVNNMAKGRDFWAY